MHALGFASVPSGTESGRAGPGIAREAVKFRCKLEAVNIPVGGCERAGRN